jgi:hypothetical protein
MGFRKSHFTPPPDTLRCVSGPCWCLIEIHVYVLVEGMGHPHLQRLKTKLPESNEKLEERDRCIATLRAQCAHDDEERERVTAALRNVSNRTVNVRRGPKCVAGGYDART